MQRPGQGERGGSYEAPAPSPSPSAGTPFPEEASDRRHRRGPLHTPLAADLILAILVLGFILVVAFHDVVFFGKTLLPDAVTAGTMGFDGPFGNPPDEREISRYIVDPGGAAWQDEPNIKRAHEEYFNGDVALWISNQGLGMPLAANMKSGVLNPFRIPLLLSPEPGVWDAFLLFRLLIAGLGAFLFIRILGLARIPALGAGTVYMLGGYFMLFISNVELDPVVLMPFGLIAAEMLARRPQWGQVAFTAAISALIVLAGFPESSFLAIVFISTYFLYRVAHTWLADRDRREALRRLLSFSLAGILALGLTSYLLIPFVEYVQASDNFTGPRNLTGLYKDPLKPLITLFLPYWNGPPLENLQGTGDTGIRNYVGVAAPLLAIVALSNRRRLGQATWFFLGASVVILAKVYGAPVVHPLLSHLPGFELTNFPRFSASLVSFCFAVLTAVALERVSYGRVAPAVLGAAAGTLVALIVWLLFLNRDILGNIPSGYLARQLLLAAFFAAATITLVALASRAAIGRYASVLLIAVLAAELFVFLPKFGRPDRADPYAEPGFVTFLKADQSVFRIFALDALLYPNVAMAYDLDDIRSVDPIFPKRYLRFIRKFMDPAVTGGGYAGQAALGHGGQTKYAGNPLFDMVNVRYVITAGSLPEVDTGDPQYALVYDDEVRVYRNNNALPRAFVVHNARSAKHEAEAELLMKAPDFDPSRTAVVEGDMPAEQLSTLNSPLPGSPAEIIRYSNRHVSVAVDMAAPGLLVLSDAFFPGWKASVDGKDVPIYRTNYMLRSIYVPEGKHTVDFSYRPRSYRVGTVITAGTLLTMLLVTGAITFPAALRRIGQRGSAPGP